MTREEAIKKLKDILEESTETDHSVCYVTSDDADAIKAAIEALSAEPCKDAVSRQAARDAIKMLDVDIDPHKSDENDMFWNDAIDASLRAVEDLPSVKPKQKVGRWIPVTENTPPKGTVCLWCNKQGSVFTSAITYRSECDSYVGKHGHFSNGLENYGDIVAWMPLPEPYKAESEDA